MNCTQAGWGVMAPVVKMGRPEEIRRLARPLCRLGALA